MHFGLTPWDFTDLTAKSLTGQARFAEALGYQSFWLPENHFGAQGVLPDPLMTLASIAAGTETIKLGATSYLLTIRHPLLAAEQVAVLDRLSNARVILGVGRGYAPEMFKAFGVDPRDKRLIFEQRLELMRRAWAGESIVIGDDETMAVKLAPLPLQQPHPPIWIAAFGPKALAQAGRLGMPYLASPVETMARLRENFSLYKEAAAAVGRQALATRPLMRMVFVSEDRGEIKRLRERLGKRSRSAFRPLDADVEEWTIIGEPNYVADKLTRYREELLITHLIVTRLHLSGIGQQRLRQSLAKIIELDIG